MSGIDAIKESMLTAKETIETAGGVSKMDERSVQRQGGPMSLPNLDFDIPVGSPTIPSQGLMYEDPPLRDISTIDVKAITTTEENILTNPVYIQQGTMISKLISSCIMDKQIKVSDLLVGDRNTLMVAIRAIGYGREYTPEVTCPSCEMKQEFPIDLAALPLKMVDMSKLSQVAPYKNEFVVTLPGSKKTVTFKFLTSGEEEQMLAESASKKKKGIPEQPVTQRIFSIIQSIEGRRDRSLILKFAQNMLGVDSVYLRKFYDDHEPGINMEHEFNCKGCGHSEVLTVPLGPTFFWPNSK